MINTRIKYLRKNILKLNQSEFAQKLNLKQNAISYLEKEGNTVTERNLQAICEKFNVNEDWLRTGDESKGIFKSNIVTTDNKNNKDNEDIDRLLKKYNLDGLGKVMLETFVQLDQKDRAGLINYIKALIPAFTELDNENTDTQNDEYESENYDNDLDIEAELESYRQELEAEKNTRMYTASQDTKKA